jgi:hypothetical protein
MTSEEYFNRNATALDLNRLGYAVRETQDEILLLGEDNSGFSIPNS